VPELPEVETVRRDLERVYRGRTLDSVTVAGPRTVRRHPPELLASLEGGELAFVGRHGKYLLFGWDNGQVLVAHLRMSGQLLAAGPDDAVTPHTHAVLSFNGAGELRFVDPRTFGEFFLTSAGERPHSRARPVDSQPVDAQPFDGEPFDAQPFDARSLVELAHLGPDALNVDVAHLQGVFHGRRAPLKALLVDQRVLAGIGNIYADEICFEARLRPDRAAGSLKRPQLKRLVDATGVILEAAIVGRGSSLADEQYRDLQGLPGFFQLEHKVYGRAGQPCLSCGREIERVRFGAKSAYLCRSCQR
jgi:formamidopyrimidine-DNA glycosylase